MRLHLVRAVCAAVTLFAPPLAHADILNTFSISGSGRGGAPDSGTLVIDATTDLATTLTLNSGGQQISAITGQGISDGGYSISFFGGYLVLFPASGNDDPATFTGGPFGQTGPNNLYSGDVTFVSSIETAATPEPTPFLLLGTGLLALPFALRRTFA